MKKKLLSLLLAAAMLTGTLSSGITAIAAEKETSPMTEETTETPADGEETKPEDAGKPAEGETTPTEGETTTPSEGEEAKPEDTQKPAEGETTPTEGETTTPSEGEEAKPEDTQKPAEGEEAKPENAEKPAGSVPMTELVAATPTAETLQAKAGTLTKVYLDSTDGSDTADGKTADTAVKTFEKAKELLAEDGIIWLKGTYKVSGSETWSLADKGNAMVKRYRWGKDNFGGSPLISINMIELDPNAELTLENIVIDGNKEEWKEGECHNNAIVAGLNGGKLVLNSGAVLQNNNASYMGAGVSGWDGFELIMNDGAVIRDNECHGHEYGGGVFVANGKFIMNGGTIFENKANRGGGVAIIASDFTMNGGTIEGSETYKSGPQPGYGGGLYIADYEDFSGAPATYSSGPATFTMNGGAIRNNHAQSVGGGILTFPQGGDKVTLNISGGEITGNVTESHGGGICMYFTDSVLNMTGGEISNNTAKEYGGGIYQYNTVDSTINGGCVVNNTASDDGGGVHLTFASRLMLYRGEISNNTARFGGGVSIEKNSLFYMNGGKVNRNTAEMLGGGVDIGSDPQFDSTKFHMIDGEIQGNKALLEGSSAGVNVGNIFELGGTAKIDPDNDVFLYSANGKHIDMISTYTGTTGAEPIQITSNRSEIENTQIGTKLVYYTEKAGGEAAAAKADADGIFVPSQYMQDGLMIGESRYEKDWMTYVEGVSVKYEWVSIDNPSDVTPPRTDKIKKGTEYTAKAQEKSNEGYTFDGWYTNEECTQKFVDGTKLDVTTTLYGKWTKQSGTPLIPLTPSTPIPTPSNPTDPTPTTPDRPVTPDRPTTPDASDDTPTYVPEKPTKKPSKKPAHKPAESQQEEVKEETQKPVVNKGNPETGSANHAAGAMALAAASLGAVIALKKKH